LIFWPKMAAFLLTNQRYEKPSLSHSLFFADRMRALPFGVRYRAGLLFHTMGSDCGAG